MALDWPYTTLTTRCDRKTHWTGALRVRGRGLDQEQLGKEGMKGNCRRPEKVGKK